MTRYLFLMGVKMLVSLAGLVVFATPYFLKHDTNAN
jgi:hypothetical protein